KNTEDTGATEDHRADFLGSEETGSGFFRQKKLCGPLWPLCPLCLIRFLRFRSCDSVTRRSGRRRGGVLAGDLGGRGQHEGEPQAEEDVVLHRLVAAVQLAVAVGVETAGVRLGEVVAQLERDAERVE